MFTAENPPSASCPQKTGRWRPPRPQWSGYTTGENEHAAVLPMQVTRRKFMARQQRESHCCHTRSRLQFSRRHVADSEAIWKRVLWSNETTIELFGHQSKCHVWRKLNTVPRQRKTIPAVDPGGGSMMPWGCLQASEGEANAEKVGWKPDGVCKTPVT